MLFRSKPVNFQFDHATELRRSQDESFSAKVHDGWDIGGNANGGYLLALVSAALCKATSRQLPIAVSCHYLAPINDAEVSIETHIVKTGKSFTTATATMRSGERVIVMATGTCGDSLPGGSVTHVTRGAPEIPAFSDEIGRAHV